jgi:hypothetical protein
MITSVKLKDIIDEMEIQSDFHSSYLNLLLNVELNRNGFNIAGKHSNRSLSIGVK